MKILRWSIVLYLLKFIIIFLVFEKILQIKGVAIHPHGDTNSYFDPIVGFFQTGTYESNYRLPGYGIWFGFFYLLGFSTEKCYLLIIFFQHLIAGIAFGIFIIGVSKIFRLKSLCLLVALLYFFSPYFLYDFYLSTESFSNSFLIILAYLVFCRKYPLLIGILSIWLIFLKPILIVVIPLFYLYLLLKKISVLFLLLSLSVPITLEGFWIFKNYQKHNQFIPFTKYTFYKEGEYGHLWGAKSLETLIRAYGGSHEYWKIDSDIAWFYNGGVANPIMINNMPYPNFRLVEQNEPSSEIFTSKFNLDSLKNIRHIATKIYLSSVNTQTYNMKNECYTELELLKKKCSEYALSIKKEKPYLFYIKANFNRFKNSIFKFELYDHQFSFIKSKFLLVLFVIIKGIVLVPYQLISLLSIFLIFFNSFNYRKNNLALFLCSFIGLLFMFYIVFFRQAEMRYFMILYPAQIMLCILFYKNYLTTIKQ